MSSGSREEDGKNQEFVQIGVLEAEFDKCRKQLFSELRKAHGRIAELDKEVNKKSGIIVDLKKEITEQKDTFARNIASKEEKLRILSLEVNEKHIKNIELKKENDTLKETSDKEIKYLQTLNVEHKKNINTMETERRKLGDIVLTLNKEVKNLKSTQKQLEQRLADAKFGGENLELERLNESAGANPTLNNPNIADLSDEKRPTKLAEEFSELYDNEWTDAFEDMEDKEERDKTSYMLFLLQRASDICRDISDTHIQDIKKGLCHMTFRTKLVLSSEEDNKSPTVNEIIFNFDSLQNVQKKTVMELGKLIETNVSHQIEEDVANAIVAENKIDVMKEEMMFKYIKKCVNVCWSMCRHEPPVHIEFPDIQGDQKFDSNVFKPYTKSGKRLHYVVWPALYLHKDGPMLCKGVAQGR